MQVNIAKPYKYPLFVIATAGVVMVINMASKICAMVKEHAVLMLPISTSEAHVGLMGRRHCKFRISVNVSYISYKHYFNLSYNCVILSSNKGVKYTLLLFIHGPSKALLVPEDKQ